MFWLRKMLASPSERRRLLRERERIIQRAKAMSEMKMDPAICSHKDGTRIQLVTPSQVITLGSCYVECCVNLACYYGVSLADAVLAEMYKSVNHASLSFT